MPDSILVVVEQRDGKLNRVSWETLTAGQALSSAGRISHSIRGLRSRGRFLGWLRPGFPGALSQPALHLGAQAGALSSGPVRLSTARQRRVTRWPGPRFRTDFLSAAKDLGAA